MLKSHMGVVAIVLTADRTFHHCRSFGQLWASGMAPPGVTQTQLRWKSTQGSYILKTWHTADINKVIILLPLKATSFQDFKLS